MILVFLRHGRIEIKYAPGGDENKKQVTSLKSLVYKIEIKYAPGGDENR